MDYFLICSWKKICPLWIHLSYFIFLSLVGFLGLKVSEPKSNSFKPRNLDVFFTSVSATTVSSMATLEMETFSNTQLLILTFLMLVGGEVFTSMLELLVLIKFKYLSQKERLVNTINDKVFEEDENLRFKCIQSLAYIVLYYLVIVHMAGSTLVAVYISLVQTASEVLQKKDLNLIIFSTFTVVSTFSNCGFVPTNENMTVFKKNSGLLIILIPQILLGNTLFPACLRLVISIFRRITNQSKFTYMLENPRKLEFDHLLSGTHTIFLVTTVVGFIWVQFVLFCTLEWHSKATSGLSGYEKIVASLFQVVNARHAGESVFNLSIITPAIMVVFIFMMYLPPYTSFFPPIYDIKDDTKRGNKINIQSRVNNYVGCLCMSQVSYLVIFVIIICITERHKMKEDPLNFNVLNIVLEVVSAYGNVGFSAGYSCARQIKPDEHCKDAWYGFVGKWSNNGKFILILVMFFGRLKKFNMKGGRAWKLS